MSVNNKRAMACALTIYDERQPIESGTYVEPDTLERLLGIDRMHRDYSLAMCKVKEALADIVARMTGRRYVMRQEESGIRVLDNGAASIHTMDRVDLARQRMRYWNDEAAVCVDPFLDELTPQQCKRYIERKRFNDRLMLHMSRMDVDRMSEKVRGKESIDDDDLEDLATAEN